MNKKKILSLLLALSLTSGVALVGCGSNNTSSKNNSESKSGTEADNKEAKMDDDQYLNIFLQSEPKSIDPSRSSDNYSSQIFTHVVDGLTRIEQDENGKDKIVPGIAESWDIEDDGKTYVFHLRDAKWADGQAITAKDFEYSVKRTLDPKTGSTYSWIIKDVIKGAKDFTEGKTDAASVGVTAVDDKTFKVELASPVAYFLDLSYFRVMLPQRQDIVEKYGDAYGSEGEHLMATGAFTIKEWVHDNKVVLEKNPNYWDADNVKLEKVTMHIVKDPGASMNMVFNGSVDLSGVAKTEWKDKFNKMGVFNYSSHAKPSAVYESFNQENKYFKNAKIRKAFVAALDRETINETLYKGSAIAAKSWCPPAVQIGGDDFREKAGDENNWINKLQEENPDPKALLIEGLKEEGLDPDPSKMVVTKLQDGTNAESREFAEFEQQRLQEVLGITVKVDYYEWAIFSDKMDKGEYDFAGKGWSGDYNDPMTFFEMFTSTSALAPKGWKNEKYDELMKKTTETADNEERFNYFKEAEKILIYDEGAISPWIYRKTSTYTRKYVNNVFSPLFGTIDVTRAYTTGR